MSSSRIIRSAGHLTQYQSTEKRDYERHRARVRAATPTVDVKPPRPRPHVTYNAKRSQLQRERQQVISRENFILLKNLGEIMHRRAGTNGNGLAKPNSKCIRTR